jgi:hypothetical protein
MKARLTVTSNVTSKTPPPFEVTLAFNTSCMPGKLRTGQAKYAQRAIGYATCSQSQRLATCPQRLITIALYQSGLRNPPDTWLIPSRTLRRPFTHHLDKFQQYASVSSNLLMRATRRKTPCDCEVSTSVWYRVRAIVGGLQFRSGGNEVGKMGEKRDGEEGGAPVPWGGGRPLLPLDAALCCRARQEP